MCSQMSKTDKNLLLQSSLSQHVHRGYKVSYFLTGYLKCCCTVWDLIKYTKILFKHFETAYSATDSYFEILVLQVLKVSTNGSSFSAERDIEMRFCNQYQSRTKLCPPQ